MKKTILFLVLLILILPFNLSAQDEGLRIVSPHPDLKVKITRCEAVGDNICEIDITLENYADREVDFIVYGGNGSVPYSDIQNATCSEAYDSNGNAYLEDKVKMKGTQHGYTSRSLSGKLGSMQYMVGHFRIEDVPANVDSFRKVVFCLKSDFWDIGSGEKRINIYNLPIIRD